METKDFKKNAVFLYKVKYNNGTTQCINIIKIIDEPIIEDDIIYLKKYLVVAAISYYVEEITLRCVRHDYQFKLSNPSIEVTQDINKIMQHKKGFIDKLFSSGYKIKQWNTRN